ncbi:MAG: hypothetical protein HYV54_00705 [Parcubacteria group bacterium]|nr:hypothetical protein [Parcubacteria group bacterium]
METSKLLDSDGNRVNVGNFDRKGLNVNNYHPDWNDNDNLRVCLFRNFRLYDKILHTEDFV